MQDGLQAALTCQELTPVIQKLVKDGIAETRKIVFKGDFHIFIKGQAKPMKLPAKLEFNDKPETVQLIQDALNIERVSEKCLMTVHNNKEGRLNEFFKQLAKQTKQQELKFGKKDDDEEEEEED